MFSLELLGEGLYEDIPLNHAVGGVGSLKVSRLGHNESLVFAEERLADVLAEQTAGREGELVKG